MDIALSRGGFGLGGGCVIWGVECYAVFAATYATIHPEKTAKDQQSVMSLLFDFSIYESDLNTNNVNFTGLLLTNVLLLTHGINISVK